MFIYFIFKKKNRANKLYLDSKSYNESKSLMKTRIFTRTNIHYIGTNVTKVPFSNPAMFTWVHYLCSLSQLTRRWLLFDVGNIKTPDFRSFLIYVKWRFAFFDADLFLDNCMGCCFYSPVENKQSSYFTMWLYSV